MNSKSGRSKSSDIGAAHESPVDVCDHLISTSLRDLRKKYKDLSHVQGEPADLDKKKLDKIVELTKSNLN